MSYSTRIHSCFYLWKKKYTLFHEYHVCGLDSVLLINKSDNVEAVSNLVQHVKYMYEQNLAIHVFMYIVIVYRMLMSLRSQILLQRQTGKDMWPD